MVTTNYNYFCNMLYTKEGCTYKRLQRLHTDSFVEGYVIVIFSGGVLLKISVFSFIHFVHHEKLCFALEKCLFRFGIIQVSFKEEQFCRELPEGSREKDGMEVSYVGLGGILCRGLEW